MLRWLWGVPWTARRSNQSILKEISPGCSLEGLMLKLKLQYFGHLMWRTDLFETWCWERFRAGGKGDNRGWDGWMASPTQWTWVWVDSGSWWWTERPGVLSDWTELKITKNPRSENNNGSRWPCPVVVPNKAISRRKKNWQWLRKIEVGKKIFAEWRPSCKCSIEKCKRCAIFKTWIIRYRNWYTPVKNSDGRYRQTGSLKETVNWSISQDEGPPVVQWLRLHS